jgi:virulence-associated protein VagC
VKIRRDGEKIILEPLERSQWPEGFWELFLSDPDFSAPEALPTVEISLE